MDHDVLLLVTGNMKTYGGSFVKALAECLLLADPINLRKLESTFTEYIEKYKNFQVIGNRARPEDTQG